MKEQFIDFVKSNMQKLNDARREGRLIFADDLVINNKPGSAYLDVSLDEIRKKFQVDTIKQMNNGYTNSKYFELYPPYNTLTEFYPKYKEVFVKPSWCYRLRAGKKASEAIQDIQTSAVMIIDCNVAVTICQYLALLELLRSRLGDQKAAEIFDNLFSHSKHPMIISPSNLELGTHLECCTQNNQLIAPLNPLFYFTEFKVLLKNERHQLGDRIYMRNFREYKQIHPLGSDNGIMTICVDEKEQKYIGLEIEENSLSELEIKKMFLKACKLPQFKLKQNFLKEDVNYFNVLISRNVPQKSPNSVQLKDIPGADLEVTRMNFKKIAKLIENPSNVIDKFKSAFFQEKHLVADLRYMALTKKGIILTSPQVNNCHMASKKLCKFGFIYSNTQISDNKAYLEDEVKMLRSDVPKI